MSKTMSSLNYNVAFVLHAAIEIPAAINFMLFPSKQLGRNTPNAHGVIRQYALLLAVSVLIAMTFAVRPTDDLSRTVAGYLAIYHPGPALRSCARLSRQYKRSERLLLSEAFLYLTCHLLTGAALVFYYLDVDVIRI